MQKPPNTQLRTNLGTILADHKAALAATFPRWDDELASSTTTATEVQQAVERPLNQWFTAVDAALDASSGTVLKVGEIRGGRGTYTEREIQSQTGAAVREGKSAFTAAQSSATALAGSLVTTLERWGRVPRPAPVDAVQEAALGNLRADLRMMCDPVRTDDVQDVLVRVAGDAVAAGDALRVWFLASSGWVPDYCRARGMSDTLSTTNAVLDAVASTVGPEQKQAAAGLRVIGTGRRSFSQIATVWLPSIWEIDAASMDEPYPASAGVA